MRPVDDMRSDENRLRILVVFDGDRAMSPSMAANDGSRFEVRVETFGLSGLNAAAIGGDTIDAMIVEVDPNSPDALRRLHNLARDQAGKMPILATVRDLTVSAARQVLKAGAADVLPLPFSESDLIAAIEPVMNALHGTRSGAEPARQGRIVSFLGSRGGSGVTALATQAGILWSERARVCLIDFDLQAGNASLYLDLSPSLGLLDIVGAGARLDGELLSSIAGRHPSGLDVIAAPVDVAPLDTLSVHAIDTVLTLATQLYDVVLIDLPKSWTVWSLRAIEMSDVTVLVTALSVSGLHQARRQLAVLDANGIADHLKVVVNRVEQPVFGKIDLGETQSILGRAVDFTIADDAKTMNAAVDLGKPLAKVKAGSRLEKDLKAMVNSLSVQFQNAPAK